MKLISWNCNRAFRQKYSCLESYCADIIVAPESESPQKLAKFRSCIPCTDHIWVGDSDTQGLSIFTFNGYHARIADFYLPEYKHVVPLEVRHGSWKLLMIAVWTKGGPSSRNSYVVYATKALKAYRHYLNEDTLIIGDFNSNKLWDKHFNRKYNHSRMLEFLDKMHFGSVYHCIKHENHGEESIPTICMYRNPERIYHIDYAFIHEKKLKDIKDFHIGDKDSWLSYSDHMPLFLEIAI